MTSTRKLNHHADPEKEELYYQVQEMIRSGDLPEEYSENITKYDLGSDEDTMDILVELLEGSDYYKKKNTRTPAEEWKEVYNQMRSDLFTFFQRKMTGHSTTYSG